MLRKILLMRKRYILQLLFLLFICFETAGQQQELSADTVQLKNRLNGDFSNSRLNPYSYHPDTAKHLLRNTSLHETVYVFRNKIYRNDTVFINRVKKGEFKVVSSIYDQYSKSGINLILFLELKEPMIY